MSHHDEKETNKDAPISILQPWKGGIVKPEDLENLIEKRKRENGFCEELYLLDQLGGTGYLSDKLGTDFEKGIRSSEIQERLACFGSNERKLPELKSFCRLVWEALEDFTLRILCVAAVVSILVNELTADDEEKSIAWIDGLAILVAVALAVFVGSINNYQKDREFRKQTEGNDDEKRISVFRDGQLASIHPKTLVVGDIIKLDEGMDLPADGIILEAHDLSVDEAAMTGETDPIKKAAYDTCIEKRDTIDREGKRNTHAKEILNPMILQGTQIAAGSGKYLVLCVGKLTVMGKLKALIETDTEATPLQQKLEKIARDIGRFGLISAIFTVFILILRFLIDRGIQGDWSNGSNYVQFVDYFIIGITVVVVAIPEGLPLAVTLSLAFSIKKMLVDNNLVRRMEACETMGGANMICSDKTGTLTQNKMTLTTIWNDKMVKINTDLKEDDLSKYIPSTHIDHYHFGFGLNTGATLEPLKGSKTDIAMLQLLEKCKVNFTALQGTHIKKSTIKFPFSSARKRQAIILEGLPGTSSRRMYIKGASDMVLATCTQYHSFESGTVVPITPQIRTKMEAAIKELAGHALRTIVCGYKEIDANEDHESADANNVHEIEKNNIILTGILGIKDILRPEVKDAVKDCKDAGIKVRMVTGDHADTAEAIALECGIIEAPGPDRVIVGAKFYERIGGIMCTKCEKERCGCPRNQSEYDDQKKALDGKDPNPIRVDTVKNKEEFKKIVETLDCMARSQPEHKYALVTGLMELGNVVAVTGDGTNDGPALKKANVGFAMGIAGTEVAKEAADIILRDDNFSSIVKAIIWGRNIYDSIKKFLQFQLTVNLVAVICTAVGAAITKQPVLSAVQLLWVNLIMDTLASLALATEPPRRALLYRKPHGKDDYMVTRIMSKHIVGQAVYQIAVMMVIIFSADFWVPEYLTPSPGGFSCEQIYSGHGGTCTAVLVPNSTTVASYIVTGQNCMRSGRFYYVDSGLIDYKDLYEHIGPSRHMTLVFNTFVLMQVLNFFNARKLEDELNIFENIGKSSLFVIIVIIIIVGQLIMGNFGGRPLSVSLQYQDPRQWLIALAFAFGTWGVRFLCRSIKFEKLCPETGNKMVDPLNDNSKIMNLKRSSEDSVQRKFTQMGGAAVRNNSKQLSINKLSHAQ
jgi:Ca2+ transporting ATPase